MQRAKQEQAPILVKSFCLSHRWNEGNRPAHEPAVPAGAGGLHLPPHTLHWLPHLPGGGCCQREEHQHMWDQVTGEESGCWGHVLCLCVWLSESWLTQSSTAGPCLPSGKVTKPKGNPKKKRKEGTFSPLIPSPFLSWPNETKCFVYEPCPLPLKCLVNAKGCA